MSVQALIHSIIQRIATGPELSKNIKLEEAEQAMTAILNGEVDEVQSAIFLIALRMKRETIEENFGILDSLLQSTDRQQSKIENLIDLGDPYSGYNRSIPISAFLPPLLAELGFPAVIHGLDSVAPKFGLTHRHINQALGRDINISPKEAKAQLEDPNKGWAYLDQSLYCESLHNLIPLRNKIIKRTVVNTVESLIGPIRGKRTHSVLGFVHKPYPPIYAALTARAGFDTSLVIRGVEGGVVPSLRQKGLMISYVGNQEMGRVEIDPKSMGIAQELRAISFPDNWCIDHNKIDLAQLTAQLGKEALSGEKGMFYDGLVYSASLILWHLQKFKNLADAAEFVREALNSGKVLNRL